MRQIDRKNVNPAKRHPKPLRRLLSRPLENKCRKARGMEERRRPSNPHPPRCASQTCFSLEQIKRFRLKTALQKWWAKPTSLSLSCPAQELERWAKPNNHTRWPPPGSASTLASGHLALLKQCLQNSAWAPRWKHPPLQDRPEVNRRLPEGGTASSFGKCPIRARENNCWTWFCSEDQWPPRWLHRIHVAITKLADTYLTSHLLVFLG